MEYCGDCIHYIHTDEPFCDARPAGRNFAGYLNTACELFARGDSTKARSEYLANYNTIKFKTQQEKHMEEVIKAQQELATKTCKKCGRTLPASEFGRHAKSHDGLQPYCKECRSKQIAKARQGKKEDDPHVVPIKGDYSDASLVAEIRRRGYEVKATKFVEL